MTGGTSRCDIAIIGGGLSGALAALALAAKRPELDVRLIDPAPIGGNHVWSFFDSDIAASHRWLIAPLVRHHWRGYDVAFPAYQRTIRMGYKSVTSDALRAAVARALPAERIYADRAIHMAPDHLLFGEGGRLDARHVIDARGSGALAGLDGGWQKFVGQELTIEGGHGLTQPVVMDATVEQIGGYRFVYLLPFDAETVFVEDTYYTNDADLDVDAIRARIAAYVEARGWRITVIGHEETGVLPVVTAGDFERMWPASDRVGRIGTRAGTFHALTSYSLPDAVRTAMDLIDMVDEPNIGIGLRERAKTAWRRQRFYRLLGTMLFQAAEPEQRVRIFEHFYRLPAGLVSRFYAGQSRMGDKMRILSGRPPVPVGRAVSALRSMEWR